VAKPDIFAVFSSSHAPPHADQVTEQPTGGGIFAPVLIGPAVFQSQLVKDPGVVN
jgi:hypothetical protein